jgi:hypothetical protein
MTKKLDYKCYTVLYSALLVEFFPFNIIETVASVESVIPSFTINVKYPLLSNTHHQELRLLCLVCEFKLLNES